MKYPKLGASSLRVSQICLGASQFGDRVDEATALRITEIAFDAGVNFIDTTDSSESYREEGRSERITGKAIHANRERWILATKVHNQFGKGHENSSLGRRWLMSAIDKSLEHLKTDYIDIWYFHNDDRDTPVEESVSAVGDIIRSGKVRYFGLSNYQAWRVAEVVYTCRDLGVPKPIVCQPYYNAMNRQCEAELLPACAYFGLGVVPYSPLARGMLTGKYKPGEAPPAGSRGSYKHKRFMETEMRDDAAVLAQKIKAHAEKRGMTAVQFALSWVLNNQLVASAIVGPRTEEHWREYLSALEHPMNAEDEALIDHMIKPGHPSTPGFNDPKFPILGRIVPSH